MEVTRNQIIKLLTEEMKNLKLKIIDATDYAFHYYKDWDDEHDYDIWKKKANDSMRYQRRYIATKYARATFIIQYSDDYMFHAFTSDMKKLVADIINYYGLEEAKKAEVTWDMTAMEIEMAY